MLSYILIFSVIIALFTILIQRENKEKNEGFKATQKKVNLHYRRANRNIRHHSNNLYNNITSVGNRIFRRFSI